jgi:hypothetical protein
MVGQWYDANPGGNPYLDANAHAASQMNNMLSQPTAFNSASLMADAAKKFNAARQERRASRGVGGRGPGGVMPLITQLMDNMPGGTAPPAPMGLLRLPSYARNAAPGGATTPAAAPRPMMISRNSAEAFQAAKARSQQMQQQMQIPSHTGNTAPAGTTTTTRTTRVFRGFK